MPDQLPEDPRDRQNRLLERLGTALLALKTAVEVLRKEAGEAHAVQISQGNAHLTQLGIASQEIARLAGQLPAVLAAVERVIAEVRREGDELRGDLTPVRGVPLTDPNEAAEAKAEIKIGPVHVRERLAGAIGRALPWIVTGAILGLAALVVALWLSGARLIVTEKPAAAPAPAASGTPAIPVPKLHLEH